MSASKIVPLAIIVLVIEPAGSDSVPVTVKLLIVGEEIVGVVIVASIIEAELGFDV